VKLGGVIGWPFVAHLGGGGGCPQWEMSTSGQQVRTGPFASFGRIDSVAAAAAERTRPFSQSNVFMLSKVITKGTGTHFIYLRCQCPRAYGGTTQAT